MLLWPSITTKPCMAKETLPTKSPGRLPANLASYPLDFLKTLFLPSSM